MGRRVKKIDNLIWDFSQGSSLAQSAGVISVNFASVGTTPTTLLRLRGEVLGFLDGTQAPGVLVQVSWGIIKVPEGSAATTRYNPVADANAPWLAYGVMTLGYEEYVTDVVDSPIIAAARVVVDNKAMRRIRPDEELQFSIENSTVGSAGTTNFVYGIRWLQGF